MEGLTRSFTEGNILVRIILLQAGVAFLVLFLLKHLLDRELFSAAIEQVTAMSADDGVREVVIVTPGILPDQQARLLRALLLEKYPRAEVIMGREALLFGGLVLRVAGKTLDLSLAGRIRHLWGG